MSEPTLEQQAQQAAPQIPAEFQPQPYPVAWMVHLAQPQGVVVLQFVDATGQRFVFFSPEDAQRLIQQIEQVLPAARSGLVLP